jgi:hypothetical protein
MTKPINIKATGPNKSFTDNDNLLNWLYGRVIEVTHRPKCISSLYSCTAIGKNTKLNAQMLRICCVLVARCSCSREAKGQFQTHSYKL